MKSARDTMVRSLWALAVVFCFTTMLAASDTLIQGTVTDANGKPIRGAVVKANMGTKSIVRYSQSDGRYVIGVPAGSYDVTADAWGFAAKKQTKDTSQAGNTDFKLVAKPDVSHLSASEMHDVIPNTDQGKLIMGTCSTCHSYQTVLNRRGSTAAEWQEWLTRMTMRKFGNQQGFGDPQRTATYAKALETYFGPAGLLAPDANVDLSHVRHTEMNDSGLQATINEYTIPTAGAMAHSLTVDRNNGMVWFSEYDQTSNNIARFDPETEKFREFPIPVPSSLPHTGTVLKDGTYMVALAQGGITAKLASVDPAGNVQVYDWPEEQKAAGHTAKVNAAGDTVWMTGGGETWAFDVKTKKFRAYKNPVPETFPEGSQAAMFARPGEKPQGGGGYDADSDSKGIVWFTQFTYGTIVRLDPKTGETKSFHTPEMRSTRGLMIDTQDNIWFADYYGHKIGKLDPKTGAVKMYQTPTPNSSPYGLVQDTKTGYVWYCDTDGNNIGRFDPKAEQFVEYSLPTRNTSVRFMGVDSRGRGWYSGFWSGKIGVIDPDGSKQIAAAH